MVLIKLKFFDLLIFGLIHVNLWKALTYMCLSKKILGGAHFSFYASCLEVCLRLQKNLGSRILIGSNILLKPFSCGWAFLHIFYIGIYWKMVKIANFRIYEPLNVIFGANFIPYPKGLYTRDFLSQFWFFKISIPWTWGLWKGVQNGHFWTIFMLKSHIFAIMSPWMWFLVLISYPTPKAYIQDLIQYWSFKISIPWTWGLWKGSKVVIFGRFSAEIAYFCNYEPLNMIFGANFIP